MEPVTGTVYLVIFVVVITLRHTEAKHPERRGFYEDLKDRLYAFALAFEGFGIMLAYFLIGR